MKSAPSLVSGPGVQEYPAGSPPLTAVYQLIEDADFHGVSRDRIDKTHRQHG